MEVTCARHSIFRQIRKAGIVILEGLEEGTSKGMRERKNQEGRRKGEKKSGREGRENTQ